MISIVFYNLENFFDTYDDPNTLDDDFTPKGIMHWVKKRYFNKTNKIGKTISRIGKKETGNVPVIIGLAEVENKKVLNDLIHTHSLKKYHYQYIHFESEDLRGMDVALLYRSGKFKVLETAAYPIELYNDKGELYKTRDILYCKGELCGETIHLFINHWPSRREGELESGQKRKLAAMRLSEQLSYIKYEEVSPKIILMGDFNTQPDDIHIKNEILSMGFVNPAIDYLRKKQGSTSHRKKWLMFDQILFSINFFDKNTFCKFNDFKIYKPGFLSIWKGKFKGFPFRTYQGVHYQNGYSDHFPVYALLEKGG